MLFVGLYSGQGAGFMGLVTPIRPGTTQSRTFMGSIGSGFQGIISFVGPILGIGLAVTAITGEREKGTMKMLLSQPIFRDNVLNGKFMTISSVVAISFLTAYAFFLGMGILFLGITPTLDESFRLLLIMLFSALYTLVFAAIALFVSVIFRRTITALLVALGIFILLTFAISLISYPIAAALIGPAPQPTFVEQVIRNETRQVLSPGYQEALQKYYQDQQRIMVPIQSVSPSYHINRINSFLETLRVSQSTISVGVERGAQVPSRIYSLAEGLQLLGTNIVALGLYIIVPFIASYVAFTRQEER